MMNILNYFIKKTIIVGWILHSPLMSAANSILANAVAGKDQTYIVQSAFSEDAQASLKAYRVELTHEGVPHMPIVWQAKLPMPVSNLIYHPSPNFSYPDVWPHMKKQFAPPENALGAMKYAHFKQQHQHRMPVIYQIDGQQILHGFAAATGQEIVKLSLQNIQPRFKAHQQLIGQSAVLQLSLFQQDVYIRHQWRSILVGVYGEAPQRLFCLDVTDVAFLGTENAAAQMLWQTTTEEASLASPVILRNAVGEWLVAVAGQQQVLLFDLLSGQSRAQMRLSSNTKARGHLANLVALDTKSLGYVNLMIISDNHGNLWEWDMTQNQPSHWEVRPLIKDLTSKRLLSKPLVVRHPSGKGLLMSFQSKFESNPNTQLYCLWNQSPEQPLAYGQFQSNIGQHTENWVTAQNSQASEPVVRNQRLVFSTAGRYHCVRNMQTGELLAKAPLAWVGHHQALSKPVQVIGRPFILTQTYPKPDVVLQATDHGGWVWSTLAIEQDKLGQRSWLELNS